MEAASPSSHKKHKHHKTNSSKNWTINLDIFIHEIDKFYLILTEIFL